MPCLVGGYQSFGGIVHPEVAGDHVSLVGYIDK
jgi:hypothetical protein